MLAYLGIASLILKARIKKAEKKNKMTNIYCVIKNEERKQKKKDLSIKNKKKDELKTKKNKK